MGVVLNQCSGFRCANPIVSCVSNADVVRFKIDDAACSILIFLFSSTFPSLIKPSVTIMEVAVLE